MVGCKFYWKNFDDIYCFLENLQHLTFVQILSELIKTFLSSIRVAEHTVTVNVVEKCVKCLDQLHNSLKVFGSALVKREHVSLIQFLFYEV